MFVGYDFFLSVVISGPSMMAVLEMVLEVGCLVKGCLETSSILVGSGSLMLPLGLGCSVVLFFSPGRGFKSSCGALNLTRS